MNNFTLFIKGDPLRLNKEKTTDNGYKALKTRGNNFLGKMLKIIFVTEKESLISVHRIFSLK